MKGIYISASKNMEERRERSGGTRTLAVDGVWIVLDRDTSLGVGWFTP